ncbi:MAG: DUF262 domain-containing protein [Desulfobacula sp.]|jgi:uncharacterized protein with ParB-like and HNH nuclease domain|uniref:DUF262 domain-containing protein n=1 Tax=Desulfobacula sp. TaxID=2593537 RepID=UPI001D745052|nr:DUF262 domain-containing protein [Desulfobacteraceae bacterium]MBT3807133.1 DUF262 domain-containing protein [Desulfobacula sp.]MBT5546113.1 DUF262 domain-containing protein [Desulfobacula sp.]MBT5972688.1 DUF262 domain-containing protein [Desulfobacula sp.]MBT6748283.1 DUF262 domain-containing protein [Desulfobacula sp.]
MIQNTDNKPLSELFSSDNKISYHIPKYQREYIWGKWNWEALFDDIEESDGGHFLGSIICINTQKDSHKPADLELVDGQQRMTTISLLYLAIYKYLSKNILDPTDIDQQVELRSLRNRVIISQSSATIRLFPSYSNSNYDDYKWIFSEEIEEVKALKKPRFLGVRRIQKAFNYFYNRLIELDEDECPKYSFEDVKQFLIKLNSATIVKIDVATHADAFTLFETLNNRGVPLSAIDLIKNKLLGHLEKVDVNTSLEENFERWNQIIINLTDEYKIQERFLRQFYNAYRLEKDIEIKKANKAVKSNLIRIYEELINRDVQKTFDLLEEASVIYSKHIQYEREEHSVELIKALRNLENVNGADGYMLLLFVEKRFNIEESEKIELVNLLCRYFIRRNVTDSPPTRDLSNYFMDIIKEANELTIYSYEKIKEILLTFGKPASDVLFEEKLKGDLYEENVGATRYILSSIELAQSETKEIYVNFYARNKKLFVWTVEHIFPQGENIPQHWVDMVADGDREKANLIRKRYVHKLGNLTLTGYNSQLSNMSLDKKQNRKSKDGKFIGFKNGLTLNEGIKDIGIWGKENIKARTGQLVTKALEIFEL